MSDPDEDAPYQVGYCKPPRHSQFKKGQSGNPSGGWESRRRRRAEREAKAERDRAEEEAALGSMGDRIWRILARTQEVMIGGQLQKLTTTEVAVMRMSQDAANGNHEARRELFRLLERLNLIKRTDQERGGGTLVLYPIMSQDQWIKATEGEMLPKDPLHGTPYAGGRNLPNTGRYEAANADLEKLPPPAVVKPSRR